MHTASNQIVLRNIYKNFGSINALKDISMVTDSGKIHCILGDNGAGKSTLVNIISGVFQPDQGAWHYDLAGSPSVRAQGWPSDWQGW